MSLCLDIVKQIILYYDLDQFCDIFMLDKEIYQYCISQYYIKNKIKLLTSNIKLLSTDFEPLDNFTFGETPTTLSELILEYRLMFRAMDKTKYYFK